MCEKIGVLERFNTLFKKDLPLDGMIKAFEEETGQNISHEVKLYVMARAFDFVFTKEIVMQPVFIPDENVDYPF